MIFLRQIILLGFIWVLLIGCVAAESEDAEGGSGSEIVGIAQYPDTTNGLAKLTAHLNSNKPFLPVVNGDVYLFRENFQADKSRQPGSYPPTVNTDSDGNFKITNVSPGSYILEVNDGNEISIAQRVVVTGGRKDLGNLFVLSSSILRFKINTGLASNIPLNYYIYVLGTRIFFKGNSRNLFIDLGDVPTGTPLVVKIEVDAPIPYTHTFPAINFIPGNIFDLDINLPF